MEGITKIMYSIRIIDDDRYSYRCYAHSDPFLYNVRGEMMLENNDYFQFLNWIIKKFKNEFIEHQNHKQYWKKSVLAIDWNRNLSDDEYFILNGSLHNELKQYGFINIYNEYKKEAFAKCVNNKL